MCRCTSCNRDFIRKLENRVFQRNFLQKKLPCSTKFGSINIRYSLLMIESRSPALFFIHSSANLLIMIASSQQLICYITLICFSNLSKLNKDF